MGYLGNGPGVIYMPPPGKSLDYSQLNDATTAALAAYRNKVINGGVRINQRGAGTTTGGAYGSDRWRIDFPATFNGKASMSVATTDLMFSDYGQGYFYFNNAGAVPSLVAADYCYILQQLEGLNVGDFYFGTSIASPVALSFKAVCNGISNFAFSVALRNGDSSRSYTKLCQLGASGIPTRFKLTIPGDLAGTWKTDNTSGVVVCFTAASGSQFVAAADGVWSAGNYIAAPGQQNLYSVGSTSLVIADVQLERGPTCTPFEVRPYALEFLLCQRYYEVGKIYVVGYQADPGGAGSVGCRVPYVVQKRATPTISFNTRSQAGVITAAGTGLAFGDAGNGSFTAMYTTSGVGGYNAAEAYVASAEM